jgi:hypothetical protein
MANETPNQPEIENSPEQVQLEGGTYEVIRGRLSKQGQDLQARLQQLNAERKKVFGSVETKLTNSARINTENNCIARDILAVGNWCLFGYNVHIGLRSEVMLSDVFSLYEFNGEHFTELPLASFEQEHAAFVTDFKNLFRYYKNTVFARFAMEPNAPYFYMVFQLSADVNDTKMFKWEILPDGKIRYYNAPGEHKYKYPNQYEFEWKRATREMQRFGPHPHYAILDRVFVETVKGDLTIKVEDNTNDGKGIYNEQVKHADQTLDDCEIYFADLDNLIALKVKPYQEEYRYFLFNEKLQSVQRIDALAFSGIQLPAQQGLIFSNGFYLQTGDFKLFDKSGGGEFLFERRLTSPNGEDFLYIFYQPVKASYLLLFYNVIEQTVLSPIHCNGFTLNKKGQLCFFRSEENATKHHTLQIWQTPFLEGDLIPSDYTDSTVYKIGNRDIVRAMAECQELLSLLGKNDSYSGLYYDITRKSSTILDAYYWINKAETFSLHEPLGQIRQSANAAIDEFDKVQTIKKSTREAIAQREGQMQDLFKDIRQTSFTRVDTFVQTLAKLRMLRGEIISLRDLRYADLGRIEAMENQTAAQNDELSQQCVAFLLRDDALQPYLQRVEEARVDTEQVQTAKQGKALEEKVDAIGKELELLIEIVSNLKIEDPTQTTRIIDSITSIFATLNQVKAGIKRRLRDLTGAEAIAEFAAQAKLLDQALINFLDISTTPARCDEYLTKLMVQVEELESKFAEFEEFTLKISEKREEIYNAFETRKLQLIEAINKRTAALQTAAERILSGIRNRVNNFKQVAEINGFFASDMMIDKVRDIVKQLEELGDNGKAADIQTQLKTAKEEAIRQLRDKQDLFSEGGEAIQFGRHRFSLNRQNLDLTMVLKEGKMYYHLTGTNFFEPVTDPTFLSTQAVWDQTLISENTQVYRAEYLAYSAYRQLQADKQTLRSDEIKPYLVQFSANRYQEGYAKGIHDEDAAQILAQLLFLQQHVDLLYFSAEVRAFAQFFWKKVLSDADKALYNKQLKSAGVILQIFPNSREFDYLLAQLSKALQQTAQQTGLYAEQLAPAAAQYIFKEISRGDQFIVSGEAHRLKNEFKQFLQNHAALNLYRQSLQDLEERPEEQLQLARKWIQAFLEQSSDKSYAAYLEEAALWSCFGGQYAAAAVIDVKTQVQLNGMHGSHAVIGEGGTYLFDFNGLLRKMEHYTQVTIPQFETYTRLKKQLVDEYRLQMRLHEFQPKVMSSFVRNQLIDKLYLHLIGDNLAKQIGTVGDNTRTDRMGMLLLISPPGYGKTTIMEYVANRLGLIFMKINGPAIGHRVVSLDPAEANNAAARKELEKLNLALEMGDNIMLYVDDIQHCNPEFLQKFISLTDAQRKIEGIYKGVTKTYDLRGKRVAVVMAGNPYTETGEKFRIPDMLANRSDIYNLGDIIGDTQDIFKLSYIENALTSNPILQKLAAKSTKDIYAVVKYAETGNKEGLEFEANHTSQELSEYVEVVKRMLRVRDVVLQVNLQYIASAAMTDEYRNEPAFKLQGSYRNMNKLSEKIVPIMNEQELNTLLLAHYEGESQTLTSSAEANMLKLKEIMGVLNPEEQARWEEIKETFVKNKLIKGNDGDPVTQVVAQLSSFSDGLKDLRKTIAQAAQEIQNKESAPIILETNAPVEASKKSTGPKLRKL